MSIEATLEELTCDRAKAAGWKHRRLRWIGRRAAPDHVFAKPGVGFFMVEFKRPGKEPTTTQWREITMLRESGVTVHVIDNLVAAYKLFD